MHVTKHLATGWLRGTLRSRSCARRLLPAFVLLILCAMLYSLKLHAFDPTGSIEFSSHYLINENQEKQTQTNEKTVETENLLLLPNTTAALTTTTTTTTTTTSTSTSTSTTTAATTTTTTISTTTTTPVTTTKNSNPNLNATIVTGTMATALTTRGLRHMTVRTEIGRLGNKLFQFASMYGTAKRFGYHAVLRKDEQLLQYIDNQKLRVDVIPVQLWESMNWRKWSEPRASAFDEAVLTSGMQGTSNVCLETYLQSFKYFKGYEVEVAQQFTFTSSARTWAENRLRDALKKFPSNMPIADIAIVGMHARRGDYVFGGAQGYKTPSEDYYARATRYFVTRFKYVLFIVCSDGIDWMKGALEKIARDPAYHNASFDFVHGSEAEPQNDMALLSLSNHTIGSAGSFTFWAAMLRQYRLGKADNGTTIYYAHPFVDGSFIAGTYGNSLADFYPSDWISME